MPAPWHRNLSPEPVRSEFDINTAYGDLLRREAAFVLATGRRLFGIKWNPEDAHTLQQDALLRYTERLLEEADRE